MFPHASLRPPSCQPGPDLPTEVRSLPGQEPKGRHGPGRHPWGPGGYQRLQQGGQQGQAGGGEALEDEQLGDEGGAVSLESWLDGGEEGEEGGLVGGRLQGGAQLGGQGGAGPASWS